MLLTAVLAKTGKALLLLTFVAAIFVAYVISSVTTTATYKCVGYTQYTPELIAKYSDRHPHVTSDAREQKTGFLQIEEHSRFILLWSDLRHYAYWESPGDLPDVWMGKDERRSFELFDGEERVGQLSKVSLQLIFSGPTEKFEGSCERVLR